MPPRKIAGRRPLATPEEVAAYLGGDITADTLKDWRYKKVGPVYIAEVGRHVRYDWDDVEEWLRARRRGRDVPEQGAA